MLRNVLITCAVLAVVALAPTTASAEGGEPVTSVSIRLLIAEVESSDLKALTRPEDIVEAVERLAAAQQLAAFHDLRLSTLDEQQVRMQTGEGVAVPSGRVISGFGGSTSGGRQAMQSFRTENVGTLVTATPRVVQGGTILEIQIEKSRLAAPPTKSAEDETDTPSDAESFTRTVTSVFNGTTLVPADKTVLVGSLREAAKDGGREFVILASVSSERLATKINTSSAEPAQVAPVADPASSRRSASAFRRSSSARPSAPEGKRRLTVLPLSHARATDVLMTLTQLLGVEIRQKGAFAVDERTNSIIANADGELLTTVKEIIQILDTPAPPEPPKPEPSNSDPK